MILDLRLFAMWKQKNKDETIELKQVGLIDRVIAVLGLDMANG